MPAGPPPPGPEAGTWLEWAASRNAKARARQRWRSLAEIDVRGTRAGIAGRTLTSFASNDYLGLAGHPAVVAGAQDAIGRWGTGAGASRLVSGTRPVHAELEAALADWKGTQSALVFPTGFATNLGVISALAGPGVLVCSDALNHASIVDGCRLAAAAGARAETYPHLDLDALAGLLASHGGRTLVVSDSVFSMDGDQAPVAELARLCAHHDALLVLDEAHAVLGPAWPELPGMVLRTGTLSKTLGSQGGFVAGAREVTDLLVNRCRPFIYSTGLSPADAAAALAALGVLRSPEGAALVARLVSHVARLAPAAPGRSPIFPVVLGDERAALEAAAALAELGLLVPAVRPPTVPPGSSRLRISLSAGHSDNDITALLAGLGHLGLHI